MCMASSTGPSGSSPLQALPEAPIMTGFHGRPPAAGAIIGIVATASPGIAET